MLLSAGDQQEKETGMHRGILGNGGSWEENTCGTLEGMYIVSDLHCAQGGLYRGQVAKTVFCSRCRQWGRGGSLYALLVYTGEPSDMGAWAQGAGCDDKESSV